MKTQNKVKHTQIPHTSLPWLSVGSTICNKHGEGFIESLEVDYICYEQQQANAQFIVKATNNFDQMLSALHEAEFFIRNSIEQQQKHQHALTTVRKAIHDVQLSN